jgi:UMF1 family MFS transporter
LFISNMAFQVGLIFYNALLPVVAHPDNQGKVSGLGVGVGYLGVLLALLIVMPLIGPIGEWVAGAGADEETVKALGRRSAFVLAGGLFLLFALPCLFLVPERKVAGAEPPSWALVKRELRPVLDTFKGLRHDKVLLLFFLGNFACVDTLNTAIAFFASFIENTFGYPSPSRWAWPRSPTPGRCSVWRCWGRA